MAERPIQIMAVEDSRLYQMYLRRVLEEDPQLQLCAMAASAQEAREALRAARPDVVTLDLHLPDASEFELLRELAGPGKPPVLVISSDPEACRRAIALGAADFVEKAGTGQRQEQFAILTRLKVKNLAVPPARPPIRAPRLPASPLPGGAAEGQVIALGASLGGTETTLEILRALPANMPGILIVQHMPEGFTNAYALRLDRACALRVREARDFDRVEPGLALVAPGHRQMRMVKDRDGGYRVRCTREEAAGGFCPSVDVLFSSVAKAAGDRATGVILTGIGRDGAAGLLEMRRQGAVTLGQSRETCAVYGMPAAARASGAVCDELAPAEIARRLVAGVRRKSGK